MSDEHDFKGTRSEVHRGNLIPRLVGPRRVPLGLSTWANLLPGVPCEIRSYPQLDSFWPDRLLIKDPGKWLVNEAKIDGRPWIGASNGSMYSVAEWTALPKCEAGPGSEVSLSVTYVGSSLAGERFEGVLFGTEGVPAQPTEDHDVSARVVICARSPSINSDRLAAADRPRGYDIVVSATMMATESGFYPDRLVIADPADWHVDDVCVRGTSILAQGPPPAGLPGEMFSRQTRAPQLRFGYVARGECVEVAATYVGDPARQAAARLVIELSGPADRGPTLAPPTRLLGVSSNVDILPYTSATLYARPQLDRVPRGQAFRPERIIVSDAESWIIGDVKVGTRCQFARGDDLPGFAFLCDAVGTHILFDPVRALIDFAVTVTYVGKNESGAPFVCGVQGSLVQLS
jgi:hypothetical protein